MNFSKIMNFILENNIKPEELFCLVEKVKTLDLSNEENIRSVIKDVSKLANKPLDIQQENKIVREIMQNGVSENILKMF